MSPSPPRAPDAARAAAPQRGAPPADSGRAPPANPDRRQALQRAAGAGAALLAGGWVAGGIWAAGALPAPPPSSMDTGLRPEDLNRVRAVGPVLLVPLETTARGVSRPTASVDRAGVAPSPAIPVLALDRRCTHLGCLVSPAGAEFHCPCHGSRFDRLGRPLRGPAQRPLGRLRVSVGPKGHLWVHGLRPTGGR